jgi:hypothetical protein
MENKYIPKLESGITAVLTLFLLAIAVYGATSMGWWGQRIFASATNREHYIILTLVFFVIFISGLKLGLPFLALVTFPLAIYIGLNGFGPVGAVLWIWTCAILIGAFLTSITTMASTPIVSLRNAAVGFALIGTIVSFLAHFPVNIPSIYFFLFSTISLLSGWQLLRSGRLKFSTVNSIKLAQRSRSEIALSSIVLFGITVSTAVTMLPDLGYDALAYHLTIPAHMLEIGYWRFDVKQYIWSVMPFGGDWLFVPPYFLAGEQGARLLNTSFLFAIAFACYRILVPRIGSTIALTAPAILLTWPLSFLEIGSAFIEAPLAFFFIMAFFEIVGPAPGKKGRWIVLAIFAGYACAIKLLGVLILPFLLLGAILRSRSEQFETLKTSKLFIGTIVFLLFCLPPYIVAMLKTGNPVFPFFNSVFQSQDFIIGSLFGNGDDFSNSFYKREIGLRTFWDMNINSKMFGEFQNQGALGIVLLVFIPLSIFSSICARRWWMLAGVCSVIGYILFVFQSQAYLRYVFPVLPWILVIGSWALSRLPHPTRIGTIIVIFLCFVNIVRFPVAHWPLQQFNLHLLHNKAFDNAFFLRSKPEAVIGEIVRKMDVYKKKKILLLGLDPVYSTFPDGTISDAWHSWTFFAPALKDEKISSSIARSGAEVVIHTIGRGYSREAEIMEITTERFRLGDIRVGEVKQELLYTRERLNNPDLSIHKGAGWNLNGASMSPLGIEVNNDITINQVIDFKYKRLPSLAPDLARLVKLILLSNVNTDRILLEMNVICLPGQSFRSQINWLDANNKFISTDIAVHSCNLAGTDVNRTLLRPAKAEIGIVYGGSTDEKYVTINKISIRSTE